MVAETVCPRGHAEVPLGRGAVTELVRGLPWRRQYPDRDQVYHSSLQIRVSGPDHPVPSQLHCRLSSRVRQRVHSFHLQRLAGCGNWARNHRRHQGQSLRHHRPRQSLVRGRLGLYRWRWRHDAVERKLLLRPRGRWQQRHPWGLEREQHQLDGLRHLYLWRHRFAHIHHRVAVCLPRRPSPDQVRAEREPNDPVPSEPRALCPNPRIRDQLDDGADFHWLNRSRSDWTRRHINPWRRVRELCLWRDLDRLLRPRILHVRG